MQLSTLIDRSWITAQRMLRKFRITQGDQNSLYKLTGSIELDGNFLGGKCAGKCSPAAAEKNSHVKLLSILMLNLILFGGYQIPHSDLYTNACRIKAEHKDAKEQNNLGWMYANGQDTVQD